MRFSESEIVEDMLEHIRQAGGEFREWHVGTATNAVASGQLSVARKQAADGPLGGGQAETSLLRREAYTTFAAEEVAERLAGFGLQRERATTSNPAAAVHNGTTVFVYRASAAARTGYRGVGVGGGTEPSGANAAQFSLVRGS